ncbi:MAG: imidazole glycerol phosphate synthase subunit HisH [Victivallaceae bacterium]
MIAVLDYSMGNLLSVTKALETAGAEVRIVDNPVDAAKFNAVILPGVGNFGEGMENLRSSGMDKVVLQHAAAGKPLLGICLGMQMMLQSSEEAPGVAGLGLFPGQVKRFPSGIDKVPLMGWNTLKINHMHPLVNGVKDDTYFYFVHSFYASCDDENIIAKSEYIVEYASIIGKNNVAGVQFHPEKSQSDGLHLLGNFVNYCKKFEI